MLPGVSQIQDKRIKAIRETNDRAFADDRLASYCMLPISDGVALGIKA